MVAGPMGAWLCGWVPGCADGCARAGRLSWPQPLSAEAWAREHVRCCPALALTALRRCLCSRR